MAQSEFGFRIAFDAMGGDKTLSVTVPSAVSFCRRNPDCELLLVGHEEKIEKMLQSSKLEKSPNMRIVHAKDEVQMDESPIKALRNKKNSSIYQAIRMVKKGQADACVSAGNTGALMAISWFVLSTIDPIQRPAIVTALPNVNGKVYMLDLGANVNHDAINLYQCAFMGVKMCELLDGKKKPRVALLNVGTEDGKGGNKAIFEADQMLKQSHLNYIGYVEGDSVFMGEQDVVVCDGFVGNVALKISEGLARMISAQLKGDLRSGLMNRIGSFFLRNTLRCNHQRLNPSNYGGALLVGLEKIVVKAHGGSDERAMVLALEDALKEIKGGFVSQLAESLRLH